MLRLENWSICDPYSTEYTAPELMSHHLQGLVYDAPNRPNGSKITTSMIIGHTIVDSKQLVVTYSSSEYLLGEPDPEYIKRYPNAREHFFKNWPFLSHDAIRSNRIVSDNERAEPDARAIKRFQEQGLLFEDLSDGSRTPDAVLRSKEISKPEIKTLELTYQEFEALMNAVNAYEHTERGHDKDWEPPEGFESIRNKLRKL